MLLQVYFTNPLADTFLFVLTTIFRIYGTPTKRILCLFWSWCYWAAPPLEHYPKRSRCRWWPDNDRHDGCSSFECRRWRRRRRRWRRRVGRRRQYWLIRRRSHLRDVSRLEPTTRPLKLEVSCSALTKGLAELIFGGSLPLNVVSRMACEVARYFLGASPAVVIDYGLYMRRGCYRARIACSASQPGLLGWEKAFKEESRVHWSLARSTR